MSRAQALRGALAVLCLAAMARNSLREAVAQNVTASACPLATGDLSQVAWSGGAQAACADAAAPDFCNSCVCGIGVALVSGFEAAGVRVDGVSLTDLAASNPTRLNDLLSVCSPVLGIQLLQSGALSSAALTALGKCSVNAAALSCATSSTTKPGTSLAAGSGTTGGAPAAGSAAAKSGAGERMRGSALLASGVLAALLALLVLAA